MTARVAFILCGLLLQLILLCSAVPLDLQRRTVGPGETVMQIPPRFDAGLVNSCETPATNFCLGIDYPVPSSVARLAPIIEAEIRGQYEMGGQVECATAVREIKCAQRFPRCSEDGAQVTLSSLNCSERISVCPDGDRDQLLAEGICTLDGTSPIGECRPTTDYDYQFQSCPNSSNWHVSGWMHNIMKHTDVEVTRILSGALGSADVQCKEKYAKFRCQFVGRCTLEEEPRVEVVNTYELCEEVINCYPDAIASALRAVLPCELWPSRFGIDFPTLPTSKTQPVVIERTTSTDSPTSSNSDTPAAVTTAAMPGATWPTPRMPVVSLDPDVLKGGTSSIHSVGPLLLLTIAILGTL